MTHIARTTAEVSSAPAAAQVTQKQSAAVASRLMAEADVVNVCAASHLAAAGVAFEESHELVRAARAWFAFFAAGAESDAATAPEHPRHEGVSLSQFLQAATAMLASQETELPEAVAALPALQFKLAAAGQETMTKAQFVAWRLATGRPTAAQLSKATLLDGIGGHEPSLDDVFQAADSGRKKALSADDWAHVADRFWRRSEPWDELNAYSL